MIACACGKHAVLRGLLCELDAKASDPGMPAGAWRNVALTNVPVACRQALREEVVRGRVVRTAEKA